MAELLGKAAMRGEVRSMVGHFCDAMEANADRIMLAYDTRTETAIVDLVSQLPTESGLELLEKLREAG